MAHAAKAAGVVVKCPLRGAINDGLLIEGVIDLAFEQADGWTVIDFKTDEEFRGNELAYRRQVGMYAAGDPGGEWRGSFGAVDASVSALSTAKNCICSLFGRIDDLPKPRDNQSILLLGRNKSILRTLSSEMRRRTFSRGSASTSFVCPVTRVSS